ncbi:hypothetical protein EGJ57_24005 [Brucella anthropi]|nr:hypothetical protein EGJ57_24005 [Brucella anthropi]
MSIAFICWVTLSIAKPDRKHPGIAKAVKTNKRSNSGDMSERRTTPDAAVKPNRQKKEVM